MEFWQAISCTMGHPFCGRAILNHWWYPFKQTIWYFLIILFKYKTEISNPHIISTQHFGQSGFLFLLYTYFPKNYFDKIILPQGLFSSFFQIFPLHLTVFLNGRSLLSHGGLVVVIMWQVCIYAQRCSLDLEVNVFLDFSLAFFWLLVDDLWPLPSLFIQFLVLFSNYFIKLLFPRSIYQITLLLQHCNSYYKC